MDSRANHGESEATEDLKRRCAQLEAEVHLLRGECVESRNLFLAQIKERLVEVRETTAIFAENAVLKYKEAEWKVEKDKLERGSEALKKEIEGLKARLAALEQEKEEEKTDAQRVTNLESQVFTPSSSVGLEMGDVGARADTDNVASPTASRSSAQPIAGPSSLAPHPTFTNPPPADAAATSSFKRPTENINNQQSKKVKTGGGYRLEKGQKRAFPDHPMWHGFSTTQLGRLMELPGVWRENEDRPSYLARYDELDRYLGGDPASVIPALDKLKEFLSGKFNGLSLDEREQAWQYTLWLMRAAYEKGWPTAVREMLYEKEGDRRATLATKLKAKEGRKELDVRMGA